MTRLKTIFLTNIILEHNLVCVCVREGGRRNTKEKNCHSKLEYLSGSARTKQWPTSRTHFLSNAFFILRHLCLNKAESSLDVKC